MVLPTVDSATDLWCLPIMEPTDLWCHAVGHNVISHSDMLNYLRVPSSAEFFGSCICSDLEVSFWLLQENCRLNRGSKKCLPILSGSLVGQITWSTYSLGPYLSNEMSDSTIASCPMTSQLIVGGNLSHF